MKKLKRINLFLFIYDSNEKAKWRAKIIFLSSKYFYISIKIMTALK
jgi:hypothetical protein